MPIIYNTAAATLRQVSPDMSVYVHPAVYCALLGDFFGV